MKFGVLAALFAFAVGCDPGVYTPGTGGSGGGSGGSGGQVGTGGTGGTGSQSGTGGTGGTGGNAMTPDGGGTGGAGGGTGAGAFGDVCTAGPDCMSGICFVGGMGSYCSKTCATNADCVGLGSQTCNLQGYCKK